MVTQLNPTQKSGRKFQCSGCVIVVSGVEDYCNSLKEIRHPYVEEWRQPEGRPLDIDELRRVFASESHIVEQHRSGEQNAPENRRRTQEHQKSTTICHWPHRTAAFPLGCRRA